MKRTQTESRLYDWAGGQRWNALIYSGRTKNADDFGVIRTVKDGSDADPLIILFRKNLLTGQALQDATDVCSRNSNR
jgi:hypothetical protein